LLITFLDKTISIAYICTMKTVEQIEERINYIVMSVDGDDESSMAKKLRKECLLARKCKLYLESVNLTEEILKRDITSLRAQVKRIKDGYMEWLDYKIHANDPDIIALRSEIKRKAKYHGEMNLSYLNAQLNTLTYLL